MSDLTEGISITAITVSVLTLTLVSFCWCKKRVSNKTVDNKIKGDTKVTSV